VNHQLNEEGRKGRVAILIIIIEVRDIMEMDWIGLLLCRLHRRVTFRRKPLIEQLRRKRPTTTPITLLKRGQGLKKE
jgi:hypothetical protein